MQHDSASSSPRDADRLIFAGLLGLTATTVVELSNREGISLGQEISIYAFAVAIPLLAVGLVTDYARRAGTHVPVWRDNIGAVGALAAVGGFGGLFFHFGIAIGVSFIVSCIVGLALIRSL